MSKTFGIGLQDVGYGENNEVQLQDNEVIKIIIYHPLKDLLFFTKESINPSKKKDQKEGDLFSFSNKLKGFLTLGRKKS